MQQWDKVAQQLPTLIGRLHALKALHMQSASFTTAVCHACLVYQQGILWRWRWRWRLGWRLVLGWR